MKIQNGTDDWFKFFDLAAACKGEIPEEFLDDAEVIKSLPLIFRTFRSKRVSKEVVHDLVKKIKRL